MNPFVHRTAADRYSRGRPFFHPVVMELVATRVGMVDLVASKRSAGKRLVVRGLATRRKSG